MRMLSAKGSHQRAVARSERAGYLIPPLMEDESLSSYWRRIVKLHGVESARLLAREILGAPSWQLASDLPSHLGVLIGQVGECLGTDLRTIVDFHTAYRAYAAGMDAPRQAMLLSSMIGSSSAPRLSAIRWCQRVRLAGGTFRCRACSHEQERRFGFSYEVRRHQLPGVGLCVDHGETLFQTLGGQRVQTAARACKAKVRNELALARSYESIATLRWQDLGRCRGLLRSRLGIWDPSRVRASDALIQHIVALILKHSAGGFLLEATTAELCNEANVVRVLRRLASPSYPLSPLWFAHLWAVPFSPSSGWTE